MAKNVRVFKASYYGKDEFKLYYVITLKDEGIKNFEEYVKRFNKINNAPRYMIFTEEGRPIKQIIELDNNYYNRVKDEIKKKGEDSFCLVTYKESKERFQPGEYDTGFPDKEVVAEDLIKLIDTTFPKKKRWGIF